MATRKGIHIFGNYVVQHKLYVFFTYILYSRTEAYFIMFLRLNDHPARCFSFGLRRIHPYGCKFEMNKKKSSLKQNPFKN